jgi:hypothetical protein
VAIQAYYEAVQIHMQNHYATAEDARRAGYNLPAHAFATITGNGYALARDGDIDQFDGSASYDLSEPFMLFYSPTGPPTLQRLGGTYHDLIPDPPYQLIGWGYAFDYEPGEPPSLTGVPSEAWFVHEAGWHHTGGDMTLTPPEEYYPGENDIEEAPNNSRPINGIKWHERVWDLHMWIDPDGVPIMSIFEPFDSLPGGTLDLPDGVFFYPEEG